MNFTYRQTTGQMTGEAFGAQCYAGNGEGLNNPAMQDVHGKGPLPAGRYQILPPHDDPKVGKLAMRLIPAKGNEMYGRADFFIHGDNELMNHTASEGCIVASHDARVAIGQAVMAGENQLEVTA